LFWSAFALLVQTNAPIPPGWPEHLLVVAVFVFAAPLAIPAVMPGFRTPSVGVYYPVYNQGSWDIDGSTHVYVFELAFLPARIIECDIQNRLRWLTEPSGP